MFIYLIITYLTYIYNIHTNFMHLKGLDDYIYNILLGFPLSLDWN